MHTDPACIFCKIVRRELPAKIVEETEDLIAFHDVNQMAPIHVLIIPKTHVRSVSELTENSAPMLATMTLLANKLAQRLNLSDSGYRLVVNTGKDAGQSVFHLHMHLLGGRQMSWPPG